MTERRSIQVLPIAVANMIAAGEVVDRPASVLKELMENSIDAGATRIDVEIVAGGRRLLAVSDNGGGMNRDDALLSIERHATSKIRDIHDIEHIATLGFRGEALAAVASVSRFRLTTCRQDGGSGTELTLSGGKLQDVRDAGVPAGTRIEVRDLFFNVPARRKFLRTEQTEMAHIRQSFIVQALAHPACGMSLKIDGREMYNLAGDADLENRIRELFGSDFLGGLRAVQFSARGIEVSGWVSLPASNRADRNEQFLFVNGRPTSAPLLNFALAESYRSLMPASRFPSVFLQIAMDHSLVDVNVHPTKREVKFRRPDEVRDTIVEAIRGALSGGSVGTDIRRPGSPATAPWNSPPQGQAGKEARLAIDDLPPLKAFQYPRMPMIPAPSETVTRVHAQPEQAAVIGSARQAGQVPDAGRENAPWSWCRVLGQVGGLYVLLETEDGYVVMDPHAAHERVLFERFMAEVIRGKVESQGLLMPETVELMPQDALRVRKNLDLFRKMGLGISEFGGDSFVVDALPPHFSGVSCQTLLVDIAHALEEAGARGGSAGKEEAVAQAACKAAVKARDRMTLSEIEKLVISLAGTEMPYTCPHGRPTLIFTSFSDLNKKFGR